MFEEIIEKAAKLKLEREKGKSTSVLKQRGKKSSKGSKPTRRRKVVS
jgi:hypothetical protein